MNQSRDASVYQCFELDVVDVGKGEVEDFGRGWADGGEVSVEEYCMEDPWSRKVRSWNFSFVIFLVNKPLTISLTQLTSAKTDRMYSGGLHGSMISRG